MRKIISIALALAAPLLISAQTNQSFRSEFRTYDTRIDSDNGTDTKQNNFRALNLAKSLTQTVAIPFVWLDRDVYIHIENVGTPYEVYINSQLAAQSTDGFTPQEFNVGSLLSEGNNRIELRTEAATAPRLDEATPQHKQPRFGNCYLRAQNRVHIDDYTLRLRPDSLNRFGVLELDFIVSNSFNFTEQTSVGYDIYSPQGKLLEMNVVDVTVAPHSRDTMRLRPYIYHTFDNKWGEGHSPLYRVTLYSKRDGRPFEYTPLKVGFTSIEFRNGTFFRFGKPLTIKTVRYDAAKDAASCEKEILQLKKRGFNTLIPSSPQPRWFYDVCDRTGMMVIEQAAINAPHAKQNRSGKDCTLANRPELMQQFVDRVRSMYYRTRNHTCIIAYSLGEDSGNGYNMYKAYQALRRIEPSKPIIYLGADGEWNSDFETVINRP